MTPGMNKRKLTRDTNNFIDSHNKVTKPINAFFPTQIESNDNKVTTPSTNDTPNIVKNPKDDPLKLKAQVDDPKDKVQDSLNFLQKFGVGKVKESQDATQAQGTDQKGFKKDLFVIPPFKRKNKGDLEDMKGNSPIVVGDKNKLMIPQIPEFSKSKSASKPENENKQLKISESEIESAFPPTPIPEPEKQTEESNFTSLISAPIVSQPSSLVKKDKIKRKYKDFGKKKLSTIQEEFKEHVPTQTVPISPFFNNIIFDPFSRVLMFEKHSVQWYINLAHKKEFVERLQKYNEKIYKDVSSLTQKPKLEIDVAKLKTEQLYSVIVTENLAHSITSYIKYCLQWMLTHMSKEQVSKIVSENSKYFKNEFAVIKSNIKNTKLENIKEVDEFFKDSSKAYSRKASKHSGYLSESRLSDIKNSSDESSEISHSEDSDEEFDAAKWNYQPPSPKKPSIKSTFANKTEHVVNSSKRVMKIISRGNSSKLLNINAQGISTFGFVKGGNTTPLVSEYATLGDRNDNMTEVYERLKFLCTECFHASSLNEVMFQNILKEINLYLKSYENENEDSDWDSDDECAAVSISNDLKKVIEEKANLTSEISAVEKELVTGQSTQGDELNDSSKNISKNLMSSSMNISEQSNTSKKNSNDSTDNEANSRENIQKISGNNIIQNKRTHFGLKLASSEILGKNDDVIELTKNNNSEGSTPKHSVQEMRRYDSQNIAKHRSSSIQSIRSSNQGGNKNRKKKSHKNTDNNRIGNVLSDSESGSEVSEWEPKRNKRSRFNTANSKKSKNNQQRTKQPNKGLSSFAKTKNYKNESNNKTRYNTKKAVSSENPADIMQIKVQHVEKHDMTRLLKTSISSIDVDPNIHKKSGTTKNISQVERPIRLESNITNSSNGEPIVHLHTPKNTNLFVEDDVNLDLIKDESYNESKNKKKLSGKEKRSMYHKNPNRNSTIANKVNDFVNIFDAFAGDELIPIRKPRKSSDNLKFAKESSRLEKSSKNPSKFKSNVDMYKFKLGSGKSIHLFKYRSKSLKDLRDQTELSKGFKRWQSDFHELVKNKIIITAELYTGKIFRKVETKSSKMLLNIEAEERSESVSNKSSQDSAEEDQDVESESGSSTSDSESLNTLVRFYSLPILPSEKEWLRIDYNDAWNVIHKTSFGKTTIDDFYLLKAVSHGAYGKVWLARKKQTRDLFAIKIMDKQKMEEKGVTEQVINERNILNKVNNNFIVRGVYTFQTKRFLYIVMEYMKGGDFAGLLENIGAFEESTARTYLAQIVVAIQYLHSIDIIHRDLKPDNILINGDGMIKLTDFGLSEINLQHIQNQFDKKIHRSTNAFVDMSDSDDDDTNLDLNLVLLGQDSIDKRKNALENKIKLTQNLDNIKSKTASKKKEQKKVLGTPDYIAPEVIKGEEVTSAVDWWAVGIIAFEFMTGNLPFNDESPEKIFENIINKRIKWPPGVESAISPEALDFIKSLMNYDVSERLGSKNSEDVKKHPFFKGVNWDKIEELEPPFIPNVDNEIDTTFFTDSKKFDMKELREIQMDMDSYKQNQFGDFDSTVIDTLAEINKVEAQKAIDKAISLEKYKSELETEGVSRLSYGKSGFDFDNLL